MRFANVLFFICCPLANKSWLDGDNITVMLLLQLCNFVYRCSLTVLMMSSHFSSCCTETIFRFYRWCGLAVPVSTTWHQFLRNIYF